MEEQTLSDYIKENQHLLTAFGLFAALTVYFTDVLAKTVNTSTINNYIPFITIVLMIIIGMELYLNIVINEKNELVLKGSILETVQIFTKISFILGLFFLVLLIFLYLLIIYTQPLIMLINGSLFFVTTVFISIFNERKKVYQKIIYLLSEKKYKKYISFLLSLYFFLYAKNIFIEFYSNPISAISNPIISIITGIFSYLYLFIFIIMMNSFILILGDIKKYISYLYFKTTKK